MKFLLVVVLLIVAFFAGSHFMGNDKPTEPVKTESQIKQEKAQDEKVKEDKKTQDFNEELKNPKLVGQLPDGRSVKQYVHTIRNCAYNCDNIIYVVDGATTTTVNSIITSGKSSYQKVSSVAVDEMTTPDVSIQSQQEYINAKKQYELSKKKVEDSQKEVEEAEKVLENLKKIPDKKSN